MLVNDQEIVLLQYPFVRKKAKMMISLCSIRTQFFIFCLGFKERLVDENDIDWKDKEEMTYLDLPIS